MLRKIKAFFLSLMLVLALGVVAASSAPATEFHSEGEPTILTGTNEGALTLQIMELAVQCKHLSLKGTAVNTTQTTLSLFPTFNQCTAFSGESAVVDTTGCAYEITSHTNATKHLPISIKCTAGRSVTVTTSFCNLHIGEQLSSDGIQATNIGSGKQREVTAHVTGTTIFTKSGPLCFLVPGNIGSMSGTVKVAGFVDNGVHGDIHESTSHGTTYTEGAQVGIWWE